MTTPAAILRALVVADGMVNQRIFRDFAPDGATFPYITFNDGVSDGRGTHGDGVDTTRLVNQQWDLWQRARDEVDDLDHRLANILTGRHPAVNGVKVWGTRVTQINRIADPDRLTLHHALTVSLYRLP